VLESPHNGFGQPPTALGGLRQADARPDEVVPDRGRRNLVSLCRGPSVVDMALSACFDAMAVRMRLMKPFGLSYEGLMFLILRSR